jgi:hypothetical protein
MQLKPGCGCLLLILALSNLVLLISSILAATRHSLSALGGGGMALLFAANLAASLMLGFAAFRGASIGRKPAAEDADGSTGEEVGSAGEGTEEGTDSED